MLLGLLAMQTSVKVDQDAARLTVDNGHVRLTIDRGTGTFGLKWRDGAALEGVTGEARLNEGQPLLTANLGRPEIATKRIRDAFGSGVRITIGQGRKGSTQVRRLLWLYEGRPEAFVRLEVSADHEIGSNYLAPVIARGYRLASGEAKQSLGVPYDNDGYVRYRTNAWSDGDQSYEVGAAYDDATRNGLVVGSVDHDLWKSAVRVRAKGLLAFAGAATEQTRDHAPHGTVVGRTVASPRMMIGAYADWRDGLERYGDANALVQPPLEWKGSVPFGWNSWGAHKATLNANHAKAATDFVANELPALRDGGTAYVNLDSFWDNLKRPELEAFVKHAHELGLKAGTYWTPFVCWGKLEDRAIGDYTYRDLAMKDAKGEPLPKIDGGWPLDPTHPGTLARIDRQLGEFVRMGYDFVKLDFMTHGALEGRHADPKVPTGTAAYQLGMRHILDQLSPKKIGRPFFVSLSIAPLFPAGLAHSRRISCDAFANIGASEYMLNSATYGWWEAGRLYRFNDPDHSVVYQAKDEDVTTEAEGRTRLTASVVAGGMLLNSDDLTNPVARERVARLFSNRPLIEVAKRGVPFRPVDGDTGERAGEAFVRTESDGKTVYLALFNYDQKATRHPSIALERLGLSGKWIARDLWTGQGGPVERFVNAELAPRDCALIRLTKG